MKIAVSNPWSVVGTYYRNLCSKENVLNDSWNESITQDEICEILSLKELTNVRDDTNYIMFSPKMKLICSSNCYVLNHINF